MMNFNKISKDILALNTQEEFVQYLEFYFTKIEEYFNNLDEIKIQDIKFDIEELLYDMLDYKLILKTNPQIINAFLIILAEKFIQISLIGAITIIKDYIPKGFISKRLEASILYLKVNDITKDYIARCDDILSLLESATIEDEYSSKSIKSFFYFIYNVFYQFNRIQNISLAKEFIKLLNQKKSMYTILKSDSVESFLSIFTNDNINFEQVLKNISKSLLSLNFQKIDCSIEDNLIIKETSIYSDKLYNLRIKNFDSIRDIAFKYLQSIGDPEELFYKLQRGEKIIDDEKLLYKYLASFGGKHKAKLYSAYDEIIEKLKLEKFDIIDWGCGQATATMLLLNYVKERNIKLDIENITLIEPSSLALSRGLLHIDVLKQKDYQVNFINSDLDCLDMNDFKVCSKNKVLHIFSNILDIESFSLDLNFLNKVSKLLHNDSIFICVSPNRNDKLNNRLDLFYNYFDENFDTKLISSRNTDIDNATRYEKIFEVILPSVETIQEIQHEIQVIQSDYKIDTIKELASYSNHIEPIIDLKILENSINSDPDYAIFKIRKLADIITSKIYSQYEDNMETISFNDKIRYLSYEKKVFNKTITNYVQTIRTIGNRGVHEENHISKLQLDAHLMVIALISFIRELKINQLI